MKFLIVVLAVASLCLAEPEADPSFLYAGYAGYYPYAAAYSPAWWVRPAIANGYGYNFPGGYTHVNRLDKREAEPEADPQLLVAASYAPYTYAPYTYAHYASVGVPQVRPYSPHDCVTAEGCAVQTLRDHALVKRDAEADPSLLYAPAYYNAYNPYYYNPYYYARVAQLAPVVATVNKPVTYTHLGAHPLVNPSTVVEQESHIVGHAFV